MSSRGASIPLLLTSTLQPQVNADVQRSDPMLRAEDYESSFRFWLSLRDPRIGDIVIVDNSGADLDSILARVRSETHSRRRLEVLSFEDDPIPDGVHYGFGELGIIDCALANSEVLASHSKFAKVTGRLVFPRLPDLLALVDANFLAIVDGRANIRAIGKGRQRFVTTQLMLFDREFYDNNLARRRGWLMARPGRTNVENFFYFHLAQFGADPRVLLRFPINVEPVGVGAHWGINYQTPSRRIAALLRATSRRIAPDLWL
jgi:hypothetical protein